MSSLSSKRAPQSQNRSSQISPTEGDSPVGLLLRAADDKLKVRLSRCTIQVNKDSSGVEKISTINWSETELFEYYSENEQFLSLSERE
jgi:hypothetical protein